MAISSGVQSRVQQLLTQVPVPQEPVTTLPGTGQQPSTPSPTFAPTAQAQPPAAPTAGQIKVFPNGNVGQHDGQGWVHVG